MEIIVGLVEKIYDLFVINLEEGAPNDKIDSIFSFPIDTFKQEFHGPGYEPSMLIIIFTLKTESHHRVGLSRAGLTISKDGAIVTYIT